MELVTNWDQIAVNLQELERIRALRSGPEFRDYLSLVKLGTCFLPYASSTGLAFAPSRFIGYVENTLQKHAANPTKDGRLTNPAISEILHSSPEPNETFEEQYRAFCDLLGFEARPAGNFGAARKFWRRPSLERLGVHSSRTNGETE